MTEVVQLTLAHEHIPGVDGHRVAISFYGASDLVIELNDEEYAAAMSDDWEDFYNLLEDPIREHLFAEVMMEDVRDTNRPITLFGYR